MNPSQSLDVVITAGDRHASRPVLGENKAFLPIAGIPVLHHVLSAVERARCTARIFVVGNKARLEQLLSVPHTPFRGTCPVVLVEQGETLYDNVWTTFLHTLPEYTPGADWHPFTETAAVDKAVLVMPGDMPLATPFEIDEFVGVIWPVTITALALPRLARCAYDSQQNSAEHSAGVFCCATSKTSEQPASSKPFRLGNRHSHSADVQPALQRDGTTS
jgi:GTP:adenosylcobinamide-phosphate guanylyltransferase